MQVGQTGWHHLSGAALRQCTTKEMRCRWIRQGCIISLVPQANQTYAATKEMRCRWHQTAGIIISLVPAKGAGRSATVTRATKEMDQPCLLHLHVISLVPRRAGRSASATRTSATRKRTSRGSAPTSRPCRHAAVGETVILLTPLLRLY